MSTRGLTPETSSFDDSSFTPVPTNPKTPVKAKAQPKAKAGKTTADDIVASSKTGPIMILCEIAFAQDKKLEVCDPFQCFSSYSSVKFRSTGHVSLRRVDIRAQNLLVIPGAN